MFSRMLGSPDGRSDIVLKCPNCGTRISGVSEDEWGNLYLNNVHLRDAYLRLVEKYEKETGKKYDLDAVMMG